MYDLDYYEKMLRLYSKTAEEICKIRWGWIIPENPETVLDFGSGVGWFRAFRPRGVDVTTHDIMPVPQTGLPLIPRRYDVVCLWDVLEHLPDMTMLEPFLANARAVAITVPIKPKFTPLERWKHFKPGEHLHYFTDETLCALMGRYGFKMTKSGKPECPPRSDVVSFLFRRLDGKDTQSTQQAGRHPGTEQEPEGPQFASNISGPPLR